MKLLLLILLTSTAYAQKIDYNGLALGMTQPEVNALVATTPWEYGYRGGLDREAPDAEKHPATGIGVALYSRTEMGCVEDRSICFETTQIRARYFRGRVFDIDVWGPWVEDRNRSELTDYATVMIERLRRQYGKPALEIEPPEALSDSATLAALDARNESFIDLAEWQWTRPAKGSKKRAPEVTHTIRVRLYRAEDRDTKRRHSTVIVDLTDELATSELSGLENPDEE
jgi:hypothetical protein